MLWISRGGLLIIEFFPRKDSVFHQRVVLHYPSRPRGSSGPASTYTLRVKPILIGTMTRSPAQRVVLHFLLRESGSSGPTNAHTSRERSSPVKHLEDQ